MKLSLSIIEDWLEDLEPEAHFKGSTLSIKGARVFEPNRESEYLYVGSMDMIDPNSNDRRAICVQDEDYIVFNTTNMPLLFNKIMDCFTYYNDWETKCRILLSKHCSLNDILEVSIPIFKEYLLMLDRNFFIIASAKGINEDNIQPSSKQKMNLDFWNDIISTNIVPIKSITRTNINLSPISGHSIKSISMGTGIVPVTIASVSYKNGMAYYLLLSNIFTEQSEARNHLLSSLIYILEEWSDENFLNISHDKHSGFLGKMIKERNSDSPSHLQQFLSQINWNAKCRKQFIQIENSKGSNIVLRQLCYSLNSLPGCYCDYDEKYIYLLTNLNIIKRKDFYDNVINLIRKTSCRAGFSFIFSDINLIYTQQELAQTALIFGNPDSGSINFIDDYIIHAMRCILESGCSKEFYHPAVKRLERYDQEHDTDLSKTFLAYLLCGQNCSKTGEKLFLHRNTVEYRINKALECIDVNFDDDQDYIYMLISFLLKYDETYVKTQQVKFSSERLSIISNQYTKQKPRTKK